jgi:hypothetical protein
MNGLGTLFNGTADNVVVMNNNIQPNNTFTFDVNLLNQTIDWEGNVPPTILNSTLQDVINNPSFVTTTRTLISVSGSQQYNVAGTPTINFTFTNSNNTQAQLTVTSPVPGASCLDVFPQTAFYDPNNTITSEALLNFIPIRGQGILFNAQGFSSTGARCVLPPAQYQGQNINVNVLVIITASPECVGSVLESETCMRICALNRQSCLPNYLSYCFPDLIRTNQVCQNFISDYIQNVGTSSDIDSSLNEYCARKYQGFGDLFNNTNNLTDQQLCACHMPQQQYDNYTQQLEQEFPGFTRLGIVDRCLLPQCASSSFKSTQTTQQCNVPQCINIASFSNNGTFDRSSVTINQSGDCANIVGGGGGGSQPPQQQTLTPTIIAIIILSIIIIIIIFIIIISNSQKT